VLTLPDNASPSFNRVAWTDAIQGPVDANFVYDTLGVRTIATIHDGSPYGEGLVVAFTEAFTDLGGEVLAQNAVNVGDTNMKDVLLDIKTAGVPDLIFFGGFVAEGALISRARFDPEVGMEDVIFMGADGINSVNYIESAGDAAEGDYSSAARPGATTEGYVDFVARYADTYGEQPTAPFHAHAYDAYMVIANAIEHVAVTDADGNLLIGRKALSDAIRATSGYMGLTGNLTCDEFGDCGTGAVTVYMVQNDEWVAVTE
jgi:branched-chain amino acid transport system substrate-binding protein